MSVNRLKNHTNFGFKLTYHRHSVITVEVFSMGCIIKDFGVQSENYQIEFQKNLRNKKKLSKCQKRS
ncbi:CLUMA_CG014963, isoform A [Clunio marinus]|uniref:CLUMA_CG014963, isoform A n=1 Tax=Clunio marinus TaxID=568069 RepID=A0A1J1INE7_9DIPT|nr:CLUMA_CG014963, isoform A [Clunio marinus]